MRLITKKENQALIIEGQEKKHEYLFSIEAIGIKTKEDIEEVIHQCRLVENQLTCLLYTSIPPLYVLRSTTIVMN